MSLTLCPPASPPQGPPCPPHSPTPPPALQCLPCPPQPPRTVPTSPPPLGAHPYTSFRTVPCTPPYCPASLCAAMLPYSLHAISASAGSRIGLFLCPRWRLLSGAGRDRAVASFESTAILPPHRHHDGADDLAGHPEGSQRLGDPDRHHAAVPGHDSFRLAR